MKLLAELPACPVAINTNTISIACERGYVTTVCVPRGPVERVPIHGSVGHVVRGVCSQTYKALYRPTQQPAALAETVVTHGCCQTHKCDMLNQACLIFCKNI